MKLVNTTDHAAAILRNASPRPRWMLACVIARAVHEVAEGGALRPLLSERWPIDPSPHETPLGRSTGDRPFYLGGVDVLLGGRVQHEGRAARGRLDVELEVGRTFRRRIAVFGDRTWQRGPDGTLAPSAPLPFLSMRLDYELAYGGTARLEGGLEHPCAPNPIGKGHVRGDADAEGRPLPNLEDPAALLARPADRPLPVGLGCYPESGSLRAAGAVREPTADLPVSPDRLSPLMFNQAQPSMVIEAHKAPRPGDRVRMTHARRDGSELSFVLPEPAFHLHVQLENREHLVPLHLDQIGILAGEERVLLSYRVVIEYRLVRHERRIATLHRGPAPASIPPGYRHALPGPWQRKRWIDEDV